MESIRKWLIKKLGGYTSDDITYLSAEMHCEYPDEIEYYKWDIGAQLGERLIAEGAISLIQTYPGLVGIIRVVKPPVRK